MAASMVPAAAMAASTCVHTSAGAWFASTRVQGLPDIARLVKGCHFVYIHRSPRYSHMVSLVQHPVPSSRDAILPNKRRFKIQGQ
jgi:hypothetical protein